MTALILDGFDHYGTGSAANANMLDGVWSYVGTGFDVNPPSWGAARTGTNCLRHVGAASDNTRIAIPGAPSVMYVSFGFAMDALSFDNLTNLCDFRDVSNTLLYTLGVNATGSITLYNGAGTVIATTSGNVIRAQTWHFIELKMDYTAGQLILRVDDSQVTNTPAMTASVTTGLLNGFFALSSRNYYLNPGYPGVFWDDLFIRNSLGTSNNGWLGDRRISLLYANADTTTAGWTPSYYQKFGTGVATMSLLGTNTTTPSNLNASITTPTATALDTGANNFTMEGWVRFEQLPGSTSYASIFSRWDATGNQRSYRLILGGSTFNNSSLQFDYSTAGTSGTVTTAFQYPFTPVINQWYHIAVVRSSNQLLLFVNGSQLGLPIACSATFFAGTSIFSMGAEWGSGGVVSNTYLVGLYDEVRFTNGVARYTTSFTAPSTAFPRGAGLDTNWASVALIAGWDTGIVDESSYARVLTAQNGAARFVPTDGPSVGAFSTVNKVVPDDNTFVSANLIAATGILTMTTQPANLDTVTVGTKNGSTAAVYTFKTAITTAFDVLIDATAQATLTNLLNAINAGTGAGTKYGTGTTSNYNVSASALPAGQIQVTALISGTSGNSIATTKTGTAASWGGTTLSGGVNLPGPSAWTLQAPPANTTVISAVQSLLRGYKSDAGTCIVQSVLVGGLGGTVSGPTRSLATNVGYYNDIFETDPDTGSSITPSTIVNGKLQINRTA